MFIGWQLKMGTQLKREEFEFPPRKYGVSKWDYGISSKIKFSFNLIKYFLEIKKIKLAF